MRFSGGRRVQVGLAVLASALGLLGAAAVVRDVRLDEIRAALASANWVELGWAVTAVQLANVAKGFRWVAIVGPARNGVSWSTALVYLGQAINNFAPARAGDLARVEMQSRHSGLDRARVLGAVAAEKLIDLLLLGCLFVLLLPFAPTAIGLDVSLIGGRAILAVLALVALSVAVPLLARRTTGWRSLVASVMRRFADGAAIFRRRAAVPALLWGVLSWVAGGLANYWTLGALGVEAAWLPAFVLLLVLYAGAPVPALPGRVGLHQALCIAALAPFGLPAGIALTAAAIVYLQSIIVPSLVGAVVGFWLVRGSLTGRLVDSAGAAPRSV